MPLMKWLKKSTVKWLSLTISFTIFQWGCSPKSTGPGFVGTPDTPNLESSYDSLMQGIRYIRQNPTERSDERIQRYLWLDQWIQILRERNALNPDLGREFWSDLTILVAEPPLATTAIQRILQRSSSLLGKNVALYQAYLNGMKAESSDQAMQFLQGIQNDSISDLHFRAEQLLRLQDQRSIIESRRIGVLAPLSGPFAPLGLQVLAGIQILNSLAFSEGVEFVVADIGESQESLLEAFQNLVLRDRVAALIGPLRAEDTEYIFERAQILRVPVVSLALREQLNFFGRYNFRSSLTLEDQLASLSNVIRNQLGSRRVGVLFPDSPQGWVVMDKTQEVFIKDGIELTEIQLYPKDATDFKDELKRMTRLDYPRLRSDELCPEGRSAEAASLGCVTDLANLPPLFTFDVLFLPDSADKVGLILPTLPFLRLYGVQVVSLSAVNSPRLIERGQRAAEGLIFTESFFEGARDFAAEFFLERYQKVFQSPPSKLSAEVFDVGMALVSAMRGIPGPVTREEMLSRILRIRDFQGVSGPIHVDGSQWRRSPRLMIVRDSQFKELQ